MAIVDKDSKKFNFIRSGMAKGPIFHIRRIYYVAKVMAKIVGAQLK